MKKLMAILSAMLLFASGCTEVKNEQPSEEQQSTSGEVEELKAKIMELERKQFVTEELINGLQQTIMSHDGLGYGELRLRQRLVEDLISHLPDLEIRTGFIRQINEETISIDYAEKIESDEAPNGFEIINDSDETDELELVKNMTVFEVNGTDMEARTVQEFFPAAHYFFQFYISGGKVVQIREVYLPELKETPVPMRR